MCHGKKDRFYYFHQITLRLNKFPEKPKFHLIETMKDTERHL